MIAGAMKRSPPSSEPATSLLNLGYPLSANAGGCSSCSSRRRGRTAMRDTFTNATDAFPEKKDQTDADQHPAPRKQARCGCVARCMRDVAGTKRSVDRSTRTNDDNETPDGYSACILKTS